MPWYCYILRSTNVLYKNLTYNGSTNDPVRRLRQHNGEITGGAKATKNKGPWEIYVLMTGFDNHINALSCEWKIKHPTNKKMRPQKYCGVEGRVRSLNEILVLEKWTAQCDIINKLCKYRVFITSDMIDKINFNIIPENIEIIDVPAINKEYICKQINTNQVNEHQVNANQVNTNQVNTDQA